MLMLNLLYEVRNGRDEINVAKVDYLCAFILIDFHQRIFWMFKKNEKSVVKLDVTIFTSMMLKVLILDVFYTQYSLKTILNNQKLINMKMTEKTMNISTLHK